MKPYLADLVKRRGLLPDRTKRRPVQTGSGAWGSWAGWVARFVPRAEPEGIESSKAPAFDGIVRLVTGGSRREPSDATGLGRSQDGIPNIPVPATRR